MKKLLLLIAITSFSYATQAQIIKDSSTFVRNDTVYTQAKFPGNWRDYLMKNLKADIAGKYTGKIKKGESIRYTVTVSFLVLKDGTVDEVNVAAVDPPDTHERIQREAKRVLKISPKWIPASIDGKPVIYRQKQNIVFVVQNE